MLLAPYTVKPMLAVNHDYILGNALTVEANHQVNETQVWFLFGPVLSSNLL